MRRFAQSGAFFMIVALLCFVAALRAENGAVFMGLGGFWLVMAIITRRKYAETKSREGKP